MNNPIVRLPLELALTILLVFLVLGKPTEVKVEKELKSTDSFCDCEFDKPEFRAVKVKYNLTEEQYKSMFALYKHGKVEQVHATPPDATAMTYIIGVLMYLALLCLISWLISDWHTCRLILPITDLIGFIILVPYKKYTEHKEYKANLNKSTFEGLSNAINDINKFLKG